MTDRNKVQAMAAALAKIAREMSIIDTSRIVRELPPAVQAEIAKGRR